MKDNSLEEQLATLARQAGVEDVTKKQSEEQIT